MARWYRPAGVRHCPACGRALEDFEVCECCTPLPRDGLRSRCGHFTARSSYRGKHYLVCAGKKYRFDSLESRDRHYAYFCCADCGRCPIRLGRERNERMGGIR